MSHSYAERATLNCPQCRTAFSPEIWLIIVTAERPDLLAHVLDGTIHTVTCPNGHAIKVNAPLLLFRPGEVQPLLFSGSHGMTVEQDGQIAIGLINRLRQSLRHNMRDRLRRAWRDEWLEGLILIPRGLLSAVLSGADGDGPDVQDRYRADVDRALEAEERYLSTGDTAALDVAAMAWESILNDPGFSATTERFQLVTLNNVGNILLRRYWARGHVPDLDHAIAICNNAVARMPTDWPERATLQNTLGNGLSAQYTQTGRPYDLDAAITAYEDAVAHTATDSPDRAMSLNNLGTGLHARYRRTGRPEDLDAAIIFWQDAVARTPPVSPDRAAYLNNLGGGLRDLYTRTGRPEDLDAAVVVWQEAAARTPPDSPNRAAIQNNLGTVLRDRYVRKGRLGDLDAAIAANEDAVARTPPNLPSRAGRLNNLGAGLRYRYARMGRLKDLDEAIAAHEDAVACTPADSPDRAGHLNDLGAVLHDRYRQTGWLKDLDAAITAFEDAVTRTSADSPSRATRLNNLGAGLSTRYTLTGSTEDLDMVISAFEDAVARTTANTFERATNLNNLGIGLIYRYERTGQLEDLDAAIAVWQDAVVSTPTDAPDRASRLNSLGVGLNYRYERTRQLKDLDAAIVAHEDAVARTLADAPERAGNLNNLGLGLSNRYTRTGQLEDLDAAITAYKDALGHTSAGAPERPIHLSNLGTGLRARYAQTGQMEDLDAAIVVWQDAVARTPADSPNRAGYLNNLGSGLHARHAQTGQMEDLDAALGYGRTAALAAATTIGESALRAASTWASLALARSAWEEALQAAAQVRSTLCRLDEANVLAGERLAWRRVVQGVAAVEAYAHARQGNAPAAALALEVGQAGQLNAALGRGRDRKLLEQLRGDDPALFAAYESAAAEVRAVGRAGGDPGRITLGIQPVTAAIRARAAAAQTDLDDMVARITARPTYKTLFAPPAFADVATAVGDAPLAYLTTTTAGSVALLLHRVGDQVVTEALWAGLTKSDLDRLLVRREHEAGNVGPVVGGLLLAQVSGFRLGGELAAVLPALGERLMAPMAVRLRELGATAITLIPSGRLNLLPLHAASYEVNGALRAFLDEFAVTFAPSAQTIVESQARAASADGPAAALVVGNPQPVEPPLRYAQDEAEEVATLLGAQAAFADRVKLLYEADATLSTVGAALPGKRLLHFACHGTFDPGEPLDSGLIMANGEMLTLRSVRDGAALAGARLVVLSACQTGLTDFQELPDEVIGLPAGFLAAGAAGVVGSLWPVDDRSTALLMTDFHRRVLSGTSPAEALRAAQLWLRSVTWGELDAYYTKFLPRMSAESAEDAQVEATQHNPNDAAYADPYHWAAFTFSGACP